MEARRVLIDTSIFIEHMRTREKARSTLARIVEQGHILVTSTVVSAELFFGARTPAQRADVELLLEDVETLPLTDSISRLVSIEAEELRLRNSMIGFRDLLIACTAKQQATPIATLNRREFQRVENVHLLDI